LYAGWLAGAPDFDVVLLGMGEDGHTASLFPGHDWGNAPDSVDVLAVHAAPKPPPERVSLSAARLSRSQRVWFVISGAGKHEALLRWKSGETLPVSAVRETAKPSPGWMPRPGRKRHDYAAASGSRAAVFLGLFAAASIA